MTSSSAACSRVGGRARMPRAATGLGRQHVQVVAVGLARVEAAVDAVEPGGQLDRHGQVRVGRAVAGPVLHPAAVGDAEHLGPVVPAVGGVGRRPGGAGIRRADPEALVGVDGRAGHGGHGRPVLDQAADVVVGELGQAEPAGVVGVGEQLGAGLRVPQAGVQVQSGTGQVPERLRHEGGGQAGVVRQRVDHVAVEDRAGRRWSARRSRRSSARTGRSRPRGRWRSWPSRAGSCTSTPWTGGRTSWSGPWRRSRAPRRCPAGRRAPRRRRRAAGRGSTPPRSRRCRPGRDRGPCPASASGSAGGYRARAGPRRGCRTAARPAPAATA